MNLDPDDDYAYDRTNQPSRDMTPVCRGCREFVSGTPVEFNGWDWCADCLPLSVVAGREQEARADERKHS